MRMPATWADAALVATHTAVRERVVAFSKMLGRDIEQVAGDEDFEEAKKNLKRKGVRVGAVAEEGKVVMEREEA